MPRRPDPLTTNGLPTTREAAIEAGSRRYCNSVPCPVGHVGPRYTLSGGCVACQHESNHADRKRARANMKGRV